MSVPSTAAGSSMPQCAVIGWPGQTGHASPAALSQTVKTKSIFGALGRGEFVPALRATAFGRIAVRGENLERERIDDALGMAAGREGAKRPAAVLAQDALGEDRARGVAGAEEQDIVACCGHLCASDRPASFAEMRSMISAAISAARQVKPRQRLIRPRARNSARPSSVPRWSPEQFGTVDRTEFLGEPVDQRLHGGVGRARASCRRSGGR